MNTPARTRFAPSPTGFQHVGGFRTAFYAWLLAKKTGGDFLLRIEDTDQSRLVPGAIKYILEELAWFGIVPDEGPSREELKQVGEDWESSPDIGGPCAPYMQSHRLPKYKEISEDLIRRGVAYRCDCTADMLEKERLEQMARKEVPGYSGFCRDRNVPADKDHVVRFKMPYKKTVVLHDAIRGRIQWDNVSLRDTVLLKSDGFPTYHLASVVDDHQMKITHVMRGEEWLATAPLHILLYEALEWDAPIFAHLPVVKGPDGKKLSKRHGATQTSVFRDEGYLPEALLNYVVLVGWSPGEGDNQEVFKIDELIKKFSLDHVNEASAVFDYNKLSWMNGVYIRNLSDDEFLDRVKPFMSKAPFPCDLADYRPLVPLLKERVKLLSEVLPMVEFLFVDEFDRDWESMFKKGIDKPIALQILERSISLLNGIEVFKKEEIETVLRKLSEDLNLKPGNMFAVIRIAATGKSVTPPLFESLEALGKERTIQRLKDTISKTRDSSHRP